MRSQLFLCAAALTALVEGSHVVVESLRGVPRGWSKLADADASELIKLRIALEQPNVDLFEGTLTAISTPGTRQYGMHLKQDTLRELMAPTDESSAAVLAWLGEAGIDSSSIDDDSDWINFDTTVGRANLMLNTTFGIYSRDQDGDDVRQIRALDYSVPESVSSHVQMIAPITRFGEVRRHGSQIFKIVDMPLEAPNVNVAAAVPPGELDVKACNSSITPDCLRALYKVGDYYADPSAGSLLGVNGFLEEYAKYDQLDTFLSKFAPYAVTANFTFTEINGGLSDQNSADDSEANLDMQYAASLGYNTPITFYSTGGRAPIIADLDQPNATDPGNEPYLDFFSYMLKLPDSELPQTLTTSYGENEQSVPKPYAQRVCQMIGMLGARGVSVIFSSGDTGPGSACQSNDGTNTTRFNPTFPASCPWVTSVGGTRFVEPEHAVSFSSGGFSELFDRPFYQEQAVPAYLDILGDQWDGLYNPKGRGIPDVATQGFNFKVFNHDMLQMIGGTSASAPTFAGVISLLNNARLKQGLPPMGFLNPWLYGVGRGGLTE